jgi:hypothetical protein
MQRLQDYLSFKSPNSVMEIHVRDRQLLRVWIQRSMGFQDFSQISDRSPGISSDGRSRFFRYFSSPLQCVWDFVHRDFTNRGGKVF